ncbi:Uncharacterized protein APZ42_013424 [Daphnia magna]|uniref:Uncharacterized protein n=1 Tax=Daphnia magna TaxID=35525 RepID=A0A162QZ25_9CRUS|nr:Uncharacterized protein APZ42_013424 [Daphnia magna]
MVGNKRDSRRRQGANKNIQDRLKRSDTRSVGRTISSAAEFYSFIQNAFGDGK